MYGDNYLKHYGVLGMRWGKRKSPHSEIRVLGKKHEKMRTKLDDTTRKMEVSQARIDKLTKRLSKNGRYYTDIGYTVAGNIGRKLGREYYRNAKLDKRISKIKEKMSKNEQLMKTKIKELPKGQINLGKQAVNAVLKGGG